MKKTFVFDPDNSGELEISPIDLIEELAQAEAFPHMSHVIALFLAQAFAEMDTESLTLGFRKQTVEFCINEEGAHLIVENEVPIQ